MRAKHIAQVVIRNCAAKIARGAASAVPNAPRAISATYLRKDYLRNLFPQKTAKIIVTSRYPKTVFLEKLVRLIWISSGKMNTTCKIKQKNGS